MFNIENQNMQKEIQFNLEIKYLYIVNIENNWKFFGNNANYQSIERIMILVRLSSEDKILSLF